MMKPFLSVILIAGFCTANALAHAPYERTACSFVRKDGMSILAVEHFTDGIIGRDSISVEFRLPDGTIVANTGHTFDSVVVRRGPTAVDVYQFASDWIPVARGIQRFDGYTLRDITTPGKRWLSPLIHTLSHWKFYGVCLGLTALFVAAWIAVSKIPDRGGLRVLRVCGFVCIALVAALFTLLTFWVGPVSPFVFCILAVACIVVGAALRQFALRRPFA